MTNIEKPLENLNQELENEIDNNNDTLENFAKKAKKRAFDLLNKSINTPYSNFIYEEAEKEKKQPPPSLSKATNEMLKEVENFNRDIEEILSS
jgi:hypothetical protein